MRVLVDGAWGFGARAGDARRRGGAARRRPRRRWRRRARRLRSAARACSSPRRSRSAGASRRRWRATSSPCRSPTSWRSCTASCDGLRGAAGCARALGLGARRRAPPGQVARHQRRHARRRKLLVHAGGGCKLVVADGDAGRAPHLSHGARRRRGRRRLGGGRRASTSPAHAPRVADEALALLTAPPCPAGETTVILDTPQLALQIHESCGHPTECDRAFGDEVSLAGASFLTPDRLGPLSLRLAAREPDRRRAPRPAALGSFGWDDEGVPARKTPLVARGQFVGYLTSRETAARLGLPRSGGCLRAEAWNRFPDHPHDQRVARARSARARRSRSWSPTPTTASSWAPTRAGRSTTCA